MDLEGERYANGAPRYGFIMMERIGRQRVKVDDSGVPYASCTRRLGVPGAPPLPRGQGATERHRLAWRWRRWGGGWEGWEADAPAPPVQIAPAPAPPVQVAPAPAPPVQVALAPAPPAQVAGAPPVLGAMEVEEPGWGERKWSEEEWAAWRQQKGAMEVDESGVGGGSWSEEDWAAWRQQKGAMEVDASGGGSWSEEDWAAWRHKKRGWGGECAGQPCRCQSDQGS